MQLARPSFAIDPRRFGRAPFKLLGDVRPDTRPAMGDDLKLFASTFAAGFLFVSCLIA